MHKNLSHQSKQFPSLSSTLGRYDGDAKACCCITSQRSIPRRSSCATFFHRISSLFLSVQLFLACLLSIRSYTNVRRCCLRIFSTLISLCTSFNQSTCRKIEAPSHSSH